MRPIEAAFVIFVLHIGTLLADEWTYRVVRDCPLEEVYGDPRKYIHRGSFGERFERQCPPGLVFVRPKCTCDVRPSVECDLQPSALDPASYAQYVHGAWMERKCAPGTYFNKEECQCSFFSHKW